MWLNIDYYVKDKDKREELMEMILMKEETQGIIAQLKNEGFNEGRNEGKLEVLDVLLKLIKSLCFLSRYPFSNIFL